ncbi:putative GTP-binding protein 6 [Procambarus clarkii]|uniref:putative GTP-binding protein 6 n=1 Tax=Procambarus clarkii TaxID=6728 RepID=UPI003744A10B
MAYYGILRAGISAQKTLSIRSSISLLNLYQIRRNYSCSSLFGTSLIFKRTNDKFYELCSTRDVTSPACLRIINPNNLTWKVSFTTATVNLRSKKNKEINPPVDSEEEITDDNLLEDPDFEVLRSEVDILEFIGSQLASRTELGVMVLQPWVKWGYHKRGNTTAQLMLDEAVALVSTLPGVHVVDKEVVPLRDLKGKKIFGSGTMDRLVSKARSLNIVSCVFISVNMMKKSQVIELEEIFGLKVLDRYSVVLGIFRHHARTKEAKLQVALAELPYIRKSITGETDRMMVMEREKKLKNALAKLAGIRAMVRKSRKKSSLASVAVVGYTNAGKTTLIHSLTGDNRAQGKNHLFATLDVTAHGGRLPCGIEVIFIDTVGFIQDIPTSLVASFTATLEDAVYADVVVHIRDANHPDYESQGATVVQTLASLPLPEKTPIITVANKIDLGMVKPKDELGDVHLVSSVTGQGLEELMKSIQKEVLRVTGRRLWKFTLPTGSSQIQWLRSATGLAYEEIDPNNSQKTNVIAVLTDQELSAYERNFKE